MAEEIVRLATPAVYGGRAQIIASPFQFLFTGEDKLAVVCANSLVNNSIGIIGRWLDLNNQVQVFQHEQAVLSDRSVSSATYPVGPGYLLNLAIRAHAGAPLIGQTYVAVYIYRGATGALSRQGQILGGYVTNHQWIAFPGSPVESSIAGGGYLRAVTGTAPGAGGEINETIPTGARWELIAIYSSLTTAVGGVAREPALNATDTAVATKWYSPALTTLAPATQRRYVWAQGFIPNDSAVQSITTLALPTNPQFLAGEHIQTNTANLQAGDVWAAPRLTVREWLEVA